MHVARNISASSHKCRMLEAQQARKAPRATMCSIAGGATSAKCAARQHDKARRRRETHKLMGEGEREMYGVQRKSS